MSTGDNTEDNADMNELRNNGYTKELGSGEMMPFEEKVLASGLCDFTLPASFINEKERKWVVYDCDGYTSLSELPLTDPDLILEVFEKTLFNLRKASEFLIDPAKVRLCPETVFFDLKKRTVRFAYMPVEDSSVAANVRCLSEYLAERAGRTFSAFIVQMTDEMMMRNMSLREMSAYVALMRRKCPVC